MKRRLLCTFLTLVMVLSLVPAMSITASATDGYAVSVDSKVSDGKITTDKSTCPQGEIVTITLNPEEGKEGVPKVTIVDSDTTIAVTQTGNNTYTFDMPNNSVKVSAEFKDAVTYHWAIITKSSDTTNYPKLVLSVYEYDAETDEKIASKGTFARTSFFETQDNVPWKEAFTGAKTSNIGVRSATIKAGANSENLKPTSTSRWFDCASAQGKNQSANVLKNIDVSGLDTSDATNMLTMFQCCQALTKLDVSKFNTSNVTNMTAMFQYCRALTELDVSNFNTSNVTNMYGMFAFCAAITKLDVSNFDTSNVTNMTAMFVDCVALTELDVSKFDTSKVTDMSYMFQYCQALTELDVSKFNTSNVTNMYGIFAFCAAITKLDVSKFDTSNVTNMTAMFADCVALTELDVSKFDTSKVTDMSYMFQRCQAITKLDVSKFNTSNVTNMTAMFYCCQALTELDVSKFDTSNVTNMAIMFAGCRALKKIDLSSFKTTKVKDMYAMFADCVALTELDVSKFDTSSVTTMEIMFANNKALKEINLSNFDTSNVTNMYGMFYGCVALTELDMSKFDTSNVTSMAAMFSNGQSYTGSGKLTDKTLAGVANWDVSNVQDFTGMFYGQGQNLTELDLSKWDTGSAVSISHMFCDCKKLKSLDLSGWDVSKVTTINQMFDDNSALTTIGDVSKWNTSSMIDISGWLNGCTSFVGIDGVLDLSGWDTSKILAFAEVFRGIKVHTIDLSGWTTESLGNSWTAKSPFEKDIYYEHCCRDCGHHGTNEMFLNCSELKSIYVNDAADYQKASQSTKMFGGCQQLKGEKGTTFDSTKIDKSYAKVDGGDSNEGYFSSKLTGTATISGTADIGKILTATYTAGNNKGDLKYQWKRNEQNISGATENTYTITSYDAGKYITVDITSTVKAGNVVSKPVSVTPNCTFAFDGINAGKLVGATAIMEYSLDGGDNYADCSEDMMLPIDNITTDGILVRVKGDTEIVASNIQTITINKADEPIGVNKTNCTTFDNNDGTITGVTPLMEYKKDGANSWVDISGDSVVGLENGTYLIRVKASSTSLASDAVNVTIDAYIKSSQIGAAGKMETVKVIMETVKVIADNNTFNINTVISGNTAELSITRNDVKQINSNTSISNDYLIVDVCSLSQNISSVNFKADAFKEIATGSSDASNKVTGLEVKMTEATMSLDSTAVNAIANQAKGNDIKLVVDVDDQVKNLTTAQKKAISEMNNSIVVDAYILSNNKRISSLEGGTASISFPYEWDEIGTLRAAFINDDGTIETVPVSYENGIATITVKHFSHYVVYADTTINSFEDVNIEDYFYDAVLWAANKGITSGVDNLHFAPEKITTRGQMVTFLWRASGSPRVDTTDDKGELNPFTDISKSDYCYDAVLWGLEKGIVKGTSETTFSPEATVTRGQAVTLLARMAGVVDDATRYTHSFTDVNASDYYNNAIGWACENNITKGTSETTFSPNEECTRCQIVTFLYRALAK